MSSRGRSLPLIVVALALLMAGCTTSGAGGSSATASTTASPSVKSGDVLPDSASPSPTVADLTGTWTGTWVRTSEPPGNGTYKLTLQQTGTALSGQLVATGSACLTTHAVVGTVSGTAVAFHVTGGAATATYTGTWTASTLSGNAVVTCAAGTGTATWQLTRA
jgi:hypothetical protein